MGRKEAKHQEKEPVGREKHRMRRFFERVKPFALTLVKENVNKKIANRKEQAEMKKIISLLMLLLLTTVTAMAQARLIGGTVRDGQSREALSLVTVQLLKTDSTYVKGATTDDNGRFSLRRNLHCQDDECGLQALYQACHRECAEECGPGTRHSYRECHHAQGCYH